jgi:hypothetical protein
MKKLTKLPREGAIKDDDGAPANDDVEAHGMTTAPDEFSPRLPGTGGDSVRRPAGGGEASDENDVEGHSISGLPGTGGDSIHRPAGGER